MNKIPCYIRLHGSFKEHETGNFESITKAKEWLRCWDGPYTIVKWTSKMLLTKYGFKRTDTNVYTKGDYVVVIHNNNKTTNITKYSPIVKRLIWSETYKTLWGLIQYLEKNHN
jgi:hypothetical protein